MSGVAVEFLELPGLRFIEDVAAAREASKARVPLCQGHSGMIGLPFREAGRRGTTVPCPTLMWGFASSVLAR